MEAPQEGGGETASVPSIRFSNLHLPAAHQFEAYRADAIGFAELFQRTSGAGCPATYAAWSMGPLVMKRTASPPLDQRRSPAMARRDGFDHWLVSIPTHSPQRLEVCGATLEVSPARPILMSCDQPYAMERPGAEQDWSIAFVARDALPGLDLPRGLDGTQVLATPMGGLLIAFLREMSARLPDMAPAQVPGLRDATLALLRATLVQSPDNLAAARPHAEVVLRARLRGMIRARLGAATLTPARLSREAGLSRSALYRLFEPLGGVNVTILAERLAQARRLLEDTRERRSIRGIGESVGFFEPSVFSRAFRRRYNATPSDVREAARAGLPGAAAIPSTSARGFLDLISRIEV